jgi:ADP-heptose:LPS heptosyltransferase
MIKTFFEYISKFLRSLLRITISCLDLLVLFLIKPSKKKQGILILRLEMMGDFIVWLDAAKEIRKICTENPVVLLANPVWASWAKEFDYWDEVWECDFKKYGDDIGYRWSKILRIRRYGFRIVLNTARHFRVNDSIVLISGALQKIGPAGNELLLGRHIVNRISDFGYTKVINTLPRTSTTVFDMNLELIRSLGSTKAAPELPDIPQELYHIPTPIKLPTYYYILFVGAQFSGRQWNIEKYAKLARCLNATYGWTGVICGGKSERAAAEEIVLLSPKTPLIDLTGQTTLPELAKVISKATLIIGNETGAIHMAAALGTPSVCILGGGDFGHFVPYPDSFKDSGNPLPVPVYDYMSCFGCGWKCRFAISRGMPAPCIERVSCEAVWKAVREVGDGLSHCAASQQ